MIQIYRHIMNTGGEGMFKDDYKKAQEAMHDLTEACFANHKAASDGWEHGEPVKAWWDASGTLCIEYKSGKWWHYNANGEWW